MVEIYFNVQSDNGSISEGHALRQWSSNLMRSMEEAKDLRVGTRLKTLLTASGFTEVDAKMIPLPLSAWPDSKRPGGTSISVSGHYTDSIYQIPQTET